ncbi:Transmembrane 9 superfamily member 11 [Linum perenne]
MIPNTHRSETPRYIVVGFEVVPCNFVHNSKSLKDLKIFGKYQSLIKCDPTTVALLIKENEPIIFTYEVTFVESDIKWPFRRDVYFKMEAM